MIKQPTYLLVYTGGSEAEFYRMVRNAAPLQPGPCGHPIIHDDGRIEYSEGEPADIIGYERIGPRTFRPNWPSCRWRTLTVTASDGQLSIKSKCQYPLAEGYRKEVVPSECSECEQREPITCRKKGAVK